MSKYIIDTETWANLFEVKRVGVYGIGNDIVTDEKTVWSRMFRLDELEELNSDYIKEHFGELQDEAYERGYEDGKKSIANGCTGCKYETRTSREEPCQYCSNCHTSKYTPMPEQKDRIEVGDEVISDTGTKFTVTGLANPDNACGISARGFWCFNTIDKLTKTGKHYDIQSILEAMRK